jgi:hypothetical protein
MNEIDNNFYCSANAYDIKNGECDKYLRATFDRFFCCKEKDECHCYHRKHPTPEQFKEEYGIDVPPDMPVWVLSRYSALHMRNGKKQPDVYDWSLELDGNTDARNKELNEPFSNMFASFAIREIVAIVICCTPFGKPDNDWRPE